MSQTETTLTGNQAVARGALRAGCAFFATSPTMVTRPILDEIRQSFGRPPREGTVHHPARQSLETPDAPEAVHQCVAAAASGAKALAATAGADLTECGRVIGRAQMAEIPIVIVHCQHLPPSDKGTAAGARPAGGRAVGGNAAGGRAAGFSPRGRVDTDPPTTGDGDVTSARHLTWGSIPLPILAATDATSAYRLTGRAFDIAQRLHTPVILLTSIDIALTPQPIDPHLIEPPPATSAPATSAPSSRRTARARGTAFTRRRLSAGAGTLRRARLGTTETFLWASARVSSQFPSFGLFGIHSVAFGSVGLSRFQ